MFSVVLCYLVGEFAVGLVVLLLGLGGLVYCCIAGFAYCLNFLVGMLFTVGL